MLTRFLVIGAAAMILASGCAPRETRIIVVTSTPMTDPIAVAATPTMLDAAIISVEDNDRIYVVQPGDTLSGIADRFSMSLAAILSANDIVDPDILNVGQVIQIPGPPSQFTPERILLPDSHFVRGPASRGFSVTNSLSAHAAGIVQQVTDTVEDRILTASEVIERVSIEYSVDARILIALLEYRSAWLSRSDQPEELRLFPIQGKPSEDGIDRSGLYRQLAWAANQLNRGYYNYKYESASVLELGDGKRLSYPPSLNAGSVALYRFFGLGAGYNQWQVDTGELGFIHTYHQLFGLTIEGNLSVRPVPLQQPPLQLPFASGEVWFFTGGPHGGWGSGSAWGAVDFAPPDDRPSGSPLCYVSEFWALAAADGIVARSGGGVIVLDLDSDADEATGWTLIYLHIADEGRVGEGEVVRKGDRLGRPSCLGGFSSATHLHIARRYDGEWLPATCRACRPESLVSDFVMSGWVVVGLQNQEYQGYLVSGDERRVAEQGRLSTENRVSW